MDPSDVQTWKRGQRFDANKLNQAINHIHQNGQTVGHRNFDGSGNLVYTSQGSLVTKYSFHFTGKRFYGKVSKQGPNNENTSSVNPATDNRYWIKGYYVKPTGDNKLAITLLADESVFGLTKDPSSQKSAYVNIIVATNVAEQDTLSHRMVAGYYVECYEIIERDTSGSAVPQKRWVFFVDPPDYTIKITSSASGGGKYNLSVYNPPVTCPNGTADAASTDFGTVNSDITAFGINTAEVGSTGHVLSSGTPPNIFNGRVIKVDTNGDVYFEFFSPAAVPDGEHWGKVSSYTAGSNSVTLSPCSSGGTTTGDPDVTVKITLPASRTVCSICDINTNDVLLYKVKDSVGWLVSVPLPKSTTIYDVLSVQGSSGLTGFDNVRYKS